ncbi:hypothetical protein KIPB_003279, partial [Kipferlia bialata]
YGAGGRRFKSCRVYILLLVLSLQYIDPIHRSLPFLTQQYLCGTFSVVP